MQFTSTPHLQQTDILSNMCHTVWNGLPPWQVEWVPVGHNLNDLSVHADTILTGNLHLCVEDTEHGVVLEQVRSLLHTSGVVDDNDLERRVLPPVPAANEVSADTSESVDRHLDLGLGDGPSGAGAGSLHLANRNSQLGISICGPKSQPHVMIAHMNRNGGIHVPKRYIPFAPQTHWQWFRHIDSGIKWLTHTTAVWAATTMARSSERLPKVATLVLLNPEKSEKLLFPAAWKMMMQQLRRP